MDVNDGLTAREIGIFVHLGDGATAKILVGDASKAEDLVTGDLARDAADNLIVVFGQEDSGGGAVGSAGVVIASTTGENQGGSEREDKRDFFGKLNHK